MVLRYAHYQSESLRGGAEVLDRLREGITQNYHNGGRPRAWVRHNRLKMVRPAGIEPATLSLEG